MGQNIKLVRCEQEDFPQLCSLFAKIYPNNQLLQDKRYFDWQFLNSPFNKEREYTIWLIKQEEDVIIGFIGFVPVEFIISCDFIRKGCEPVIWWVSEEFKFYGLKLLQRVRQDYDFLIYHYCSEQSQRVFQAMNLPLYSLPRCVAYISEKANNLFKGYGFSFMNLSVIDFAHINTESIKINHVESFDDNDHLLIDQYSSVKYHLRYTGRYLNWRYIDIPHHKYFVAKINSSEWFVYRLEKIHGYNLFVLRLIEWNIANNYTSSVIKHLLLGLKEFDIIMIDFYCSSDEIRKNFISIGFTEMLNNTGIEVPQVFQPINEYKDFVSCLDFASKANNELNDFPKWYCTRGNGDIDREKYGDIFKRSKK